MPGTVPHYGDSSVNTTQGALPLRGLYCSRKEVEGGDEQYIRELYNIRKLTALWKNCTLESTAGRQGGPHCAGDI